MSALTEDEMALLTEACRRVPLTTNSYRAGDHVSALLDTVIDYQLHRTTVLRAIEHFQTKRWSEIRTHEDLVACLARFPNDPEGNAELASYLWGYRYSKRAQQLRRLVEYFDRLGVTSLDALERWAHSSTFEDFRGQVPGLGFVIYQWLIMRLGVETVKPDSRILAFIRGEIGRGVGEREALDALEEVARRLGVKANVLDWSIWDASE